MTSSVTPEIGEPIFTLDTNKLYIGDGTTTADQLTELNPTFATTQLSDVSSAAPVNNTFLVYNSSSSEYQSLSWGLASLPEVYAAPSNPNEILAFDGNFGSPSYGLLAPTQIDINFLSDCSSLNPQDGDRLVYDSLSGQYINQPAPTLASLSDVNIPFLSGGELLLFDVIAGEWIPLPYALETIVSLGSLANAVDDTAAAALGVQIGQVYRNGSVLQVRVT